MAKTQMYRNDVLAGKQINLYPTTEAKYVTMNDGQTVESMMSSIDTNKYTPSIENSGSMFKVGQGDDVDLSSSVKEGAYNSCALKGVTKYIDNDTNEILDQFAEGRNLSLIYCKSPILTNFGINNEQLNIVTFNQKDGETIDLRSLSNGVCDTLNVETREYIQRIGERGYQEGDLLLNNVHTDLNKTQYELAEPIVSTIDVQGYPYAYKDGHVQLTSGYDGQSLTPKVEYSLVANKSGQIDANSKMVMRHENSINEFENVMLVSLLESSYQKTLMKFNFDMQTMSLGGE